MERQELSRSKEGEPLGIWHPRKLPGSPDHLSITPWWSSLFVFSTFCGCPVRQKTVAQGLLPDLFLKKRKKKKEITKPQCFQLGHYAEEINVFEHLLPKIKITPKFSFSFSTNKSACWQGYLGIVIDVAAKCAVHMGLPIPQPATPPGSSLISNQ